MTLLFEVAATKSAVKSCGKAGGSIKSCVDGRLGYLKMCSKDSLNESGPHFESLHGELA